MEKIDLHIHTNLSDGVLTPEEVVDLALKNGCKKIAITDHDIYNDYTDLSIKKNITIVPGIEFNTSVRNLHILGYNIKRIDLVNDYMRKIRLINEEVCKKVINKLSLDGYDITINKLYEFLIENNLSIDLLDKKKLVKYLIYKGYAETVLDAYNKLIGYGQKYYIANYKITPKEVVDLVKKGNGITVIAHPDTIGWSNRELYFRIRALQERGLSGIEIINKNTENKNIEYYEYLTEKFGLIKTVGSDFHSPKEQNMGVEVDENIYKEFIKKI